MANVIEDEHTLLFTCEMNVREVKNFRIKNFKKVLNNSRLLLMDGHFNCEVLEIFNMNEKYFIARFLFLN